LQNIVCLLGRANRKEVVINEENSNCRFMGLHPYALILLVQVKKEAKAKEVYTRLEAFFVRKGKLIVKNFYEI